MVAQQPQQTQYRQQSNQNTQQPPRQNSGAGRQEGLKDYWDVDARIRAFWRDYPEGQILSQVVSQDEFEMVIQTTIKLHRDDPQPTSNGIASEDRRLLKENQKAFRAEICETSAIGRALSNMGYNSDQRLGPAARPSKQEMQKVARVEQNIAQAAQPASEEQEPEIPAWSIRSLDQNFESPLRCCYVKDGVECPNVLTPQQLKGITYTPDGILERARAKGTLAGDECLCYPHLKKLSNWFAQHGQDGIRWDKRSSSSSQPSVPA